MIRASCDDCGARYNLSLDEVTLMDTMTPSRNKKVYLTTWADWVEHVMHHCPQCRIITPPKACLEDLKKHQQMAYLEPDED